MTEPYIADPVLRGAHARLLSATHKGGRGSLLGCQEAAVSARHGSAPGFVRWLGYQLTKGLSLIH